MVYRHTVIEDGRVRQDASYYMSSLSDTKAPEISKKKAAASMTKKQLRAAQGLSYREQCLSILPSV